MHLGDFWTQQTLSLESVIDIVIDSEKPCQDLNTEKKMAIITWRTMFLKNGAEVVAENIM